MEIWAERLFKPPEAASTASATVLADATAPAVPAPVLVVAAVAPDADSAIPTTAAAPARSTPALAVDPSADAGDQPADPAAVFPPPSAPATGAAARPAGEAAPAASACGSSTPCSRSREFRYCGIFSIASDTGRNASATGKTTSANAAISVPGMAPSANSPPAHQIMERTPRPITAWPMKVRVRAQRRSAASVRATARSSCSYVSTNWLCRPLIIQSLIPSTASVSF
ncbi:hypothetical protein D3C71_1319320 [compost metagenome]